MSKSKKKPTSKPAESAPAAEPFKAGETIVCVTNDSVRRLLTVGKRYEVLGCADGADGWVTITNDVGAKHWYVASSFIRAPASSASAEPVGKTHEPIARVRPIHELDSVVVEMQRKFNGVIDELAALRTRAEQAEQQNKELRTRLLSAAGDDLCRLSQEEIKELSSGGVQIPPKEEFLASCERFHAQIAAGPGVLSNCMTLAQLIAENEKLQAQVTELQAKLAKAEEAHKWICRKLKIPETCEMFTGETSIAGTLHIWESRQSGYMRYIEAFKCDDKQGEIARQSVCIATLEAENTQVLWNHKALSISFDALQEVATEARAQLAAIADEVIEFYNVPTILGTPAEPSLVEAVRNALAALQAKLAKAEKQVEGDSKLISMYAGSVERIATLETQLAEAEQRAEKAEQELKRLTDGSASLYVMDSEVKAIAKAVGLSEQEPPSHVFAYAPQFIGELKASIEKSQAELADYKAGAEAEAEAEVEAIAGDEALTQILFPESNYKSPSAANPPADSIVVDNYLDASGPVIQLPLDNIETPESDAVTIPIPAQALRCTGVSEGVAAAINLSSELRKTSEYAQRLTDAITNGCGRESLLEGLEKLATNKKSLRYELRHEWAKRVLGYVKSAIKPIEDET